MTGIPRRRRPPVRTSKANGLLIGTGAGVAAANLVVVVLIASRPPQPQEGSPASTGRKSIDEPNADGSRRESPPAAPTAELELRRIEDRLSKAKTLKIMFRAEGPMPSGRCTVKGMLLQKEPNKAALYVEATAGGETRGIAGLVSNGARFRAGSPRRPARTPPSNLNRALAGAMVRAGGYHSITLWTIVEASDFRDEHIDPDRLYKITDVKQGPDEGGLKTLTWRVTEMSRTFEVRLWYDGQTYQPVRRTTKFRSDDGKEDETSDTWDQVVVDGEMSDESFSKAD